MEAKNQETGLALIKEEDLTLVDNAALNGQQLQQLLKKTPDKYIHKRPAKGGGEWKFVSGGYVQKVLNLMFGWNWDFEIKRQYEAHGQVITEGRLICRNGDKSIIKEQIGRKDIIYRKDGVTLLDYGNDCKASATDAMKKCAAMIGIAADIYNANEFKEIKIDIGEAEVEEGNFTYDVPPSYPVTGAPAAPDTPKEDEMLF